MVTVSKMFLGLLEKLQKKEMPLRRFDKPFGIGTKFTLNVPSHLFEQNIVEPITGTITEIFVNAYDQDLFSIRNKSSVRRRNLYKVKLDKKLSMKILKDKPSDEYVLLSNQMKIIK